MRSARWQESTQAELAVLLPAALDKAFRGRLLGREPSTNKRMVAGRFEYSCRIRGWLVRRRVGRLLPAVLDKAFRGEL